MEPAILIDGKQVGRDVSTVFLADVEIRHIGAGLAMRRILQPLLKTFRSIGKAIQESTSPRPAGERAGAFALGLRNSGDGVARAARMLGQLLAA